MASYGHPVSTLLMLGRPVGHAREGNYPPYDIGAEQTPELLRLLMDEELAGGDSETPEVYAQIHAWRALGQLRAEAAVIPLLDLLAQQDDDEKWNDWATEEIPSILGMIGLVALTPTVIRLEQRGSREWAPVYFAGALKEIALRHPETRAEVVSQLIRVLKTAIENSRLANGSVISDLIDLKATEAWPDIEAAFATGNVDESINGHAADVKWRLGLGPEPPRRNQPTLINRMIVGPTAKERADARARQRKAEKKQLKKRRNEK